MWDWARGERMPLGVMPCSLQSCCVCVCVFVFYFFFCEGGGFCGEEGIGVGLEAVFVNSCFGLFFFFLIVKKTKTNNPSEFYFQLQTCTIY